VSLYSVGTVHM